MTTATEPPAAKPAEQTGMPDWVVPLWPCTPHGNQIHIRIMGATGETKSGKTLLGANIAPDVHPPGHPYVGQPCTVCYDVEKSTSSYVGPPWDRIDVTDEVRAKHGKYSNLLAYRYVRDDLANRVQAYQYDVVMIDSAAPIQLGLTKDIELNHDQYGISEKQLAKMRAVFLGVVAQEWSEFLLFAASKCQTLYFTTHLHKEWVNDRATSKDVPEGNKMLMRLTGLYLKLSRAANQKEPSAEFEKERLSDVFVEDGKLKIVPLMPPNLKVATVEAIRYYIQNPPNYAKLKVGEKAAPKTFDDQTRLDMEVGKAEAERDAEDSRLAQLKMRAEILKLQQQAAAQAPVPSASSITAPWDQITAQHQAKRKQQEEAAETAALEAGKQRQATAERKLMADHDSGDGRTGMIRPNQVAQLKELFGRLQLTEEFIRDKLLSRVKVSRVSEMTWVQADQLTKVLKKKAGDNGEPAENEPEKGGKIPF